MHPATPWHVKEGKSGKFYVMTDAGASPVADCAYDGADAAHIVHCVNAHDALVAALEGLLSVLNPDDDGDWFICAEAGSAIDAANAAIDAAQPAGAWRKLPA